MKTRDSDASEDRNLVIAAKFRIRFLSRDFARGGRESSLQWQFFVRNNYNAQFMAVFFRTSQEGSWF